MCVCTKTDWTQKIYRVAGVDSTATGIRMVILYLITAPSSLQALHKEIDAFLATSPDIMEGRIITDAEAQRLPYLQACIKEGLRMHPPGTGWMNKQPPPGGCEMHGYFLPEGTQIATNIMYLMHDPEIFGVDADVFRPERWIECSPDKYQEMSRAQDLVFGYGRHQCMGNRIAMMEINKAVFEVNYLPYLFLYSHSSNTAHSQIFHSLSPSL